MRREAESACDDSVLLLGAGGSAYAGQLLDIARKVYRDGRRPPLVSAMAGRSFISRRIESILDARIRRRTVSKYKMMGVLLVALGMIVPLAGLKSQEPGAAGVRLDDPAFQALLAKGPANDSELARIVATLLANGMQARAARVLAEWIARDSASGATCGLCIDALRNDSRPRSKLTATVWNAFDAVENMAFQDHDGKLLLRLAQLSLSGRNSDATDRGLAYLLEAKRVGNAGDLRPTELQYLVSVGRFDEAKALVMQLNEDPSSSYYRSKRAQMWTRYIDSRQEAASRISTLLLHANTVTSGEYLPLYKPAPAYPAKAAKQHEEGSVIVEYTVTPMGRTKDVHVFRSSNDDFNIAAVESAKQYRYLPRIQGGVAVDVPGVRTKITFAMQ